MATLTATPTKPRTAVELRDVLDNYAALYGNPEHAPTPQARATWLLDETLFAVAYRKEHPKP
jgi:hypothetical protein